MPQQKSNPLVRERSKSQNAPAVSPIDWTKKTHIALGVSIICANWKTLKHLSVDPGSRINSSSLI